jgi:two-component system, NarL family, response regulator DevR
VAGKAVIEILLVDDHEVVRAGLRALLQGVEGIAIAGEAGGVAAAVEAALRLRPQVILMDLRLPDGTGLDACREILTHLPQTRILFLTSHSDEQAVASTILAGAAGYLLKDIGHHALVDAIRDAAHGRPVVSPKVLRPVVDRIQRTESLSAQERRVVALVVEGKTNKEIGVALGLSDKTIKNYLSNVFQKLRVTRRSQAVALLAGGRIDLD